MTIKDFNPDKVRDFIYDKNNGLEYKDFELGPGLNADSLAFTNEEGWFITMTPFWDNNPSFSVQITDDDGENVFADSLLEKEVRDAVEKSEDQKTLNERINKIFLSNYKRVIDDGIMIIEAEKENRAKKEKKWYVSTEGKVVQITEDSVDADIIELGPFNTKEEAEKSWEEKLQEKEKRYGQPNYNNQEYKYYIITKGDRILSGWEFKEDARDALKELPPVRRSESRVVSKRDITINVEDDGNWGVVDVNESEILIDAREQFVSDARERFSQFEDNILIDDISKVDDKTIMDYYLKKISTRMSEAISMGLMGVYNSLNTKHHHAFETLLSLKKLGNPLTKKIATVLPDYLIKIKFFDYDDGKKGKQVGKFVGYIDSESMSENNKTKEVSFYVYGEETIDGDEQDTEFAIEMTGKQFKDLIENGKAEAQDPQLMVGQNMEISIVKKAEFKKRIKK